MTRNFYPHFTEEKLRLREQMQLIPSHKVNKHKGQDDMDLITFFLLFHTSSYFVSLEFKTSGQFKIFETSATYMKFFCLLFCHRRYSIHSTSRFGRIGTSLPTHRDTRPAGGVGPPSPALTYPRWTSRARWRDRSRVRTREGCH